MSELSQVQPSLRLLQEFRRGVEIVIWERLEQEFPVEAMGHADCAEMDMRFADSRSLLCCRDRRRHVAARRN